MNVGPYEVLAQIGHGGMGVVFKAAAPQTGQIVAVKMLTGIGAITRHGRMGLVHEARNAGMLRHPNIVKIYDIGQHKGYLYLVMEYLEGSSLDHLLKSPTAIALVDKVRIIVELCSGLGYAHHQSIIHRDIKPANIFIVRAGSVKIVDFGLAKLVEIAGLSSTTDISSRFAGTPPYMSPEQLNGAPLDGRTDIWSAGVTLYQLITYKLPFRGTSLGALIRSVENDPLPPLDDSLPFRGELTHVLERALAKDRNARYPSAEAFARDLQELMCSMDTEQTPGSEAQVIEEYEPNPDATKVNPPAYNPFDLGLRPQSGGRVRSCYARFDQSGFRERIKQFLGTVDVNKVLFTAAGWGLAVAMWSWILYTSRHLSLSQFRVALLLAILLPVGSFFVLSLCGAYNPNATVRRKCRSCRRRRMVRVSKWTRFVASNTEILFGLSDCVTAMEEGNYEDAAKLLCVHGAEDAQIYAVIRYNLEFWECRRCADQSALLIVEEKINQVWRRRNEYQESYKYGHNPVTI